MPANTVKIDRSTKWGNPFKVSEVVTHPVSGRRVAVQGKDDAIALFTLYLQSPAGDDVARAAAIELRGKNLACWCRNGDGCHGDVLLRVANELPSAREAA